MYIYIHTWIFCSSRILQMRWFFDVTPNRYLWSVRLSLHMATLGREFRHNRSLKRRKPLSSKNLSNSDREVPKPAARLWPRMIYYRPRWDRQPWKRGSGSFMVRHGVDGFGELSLIVADWRSIVSSHTTRIFGKCPRFSLSSGPTIDASQFVCQPARDRQGIRIRAPLPLPPSSIDSAALFIKASKSRHIFRISGRLCLAASRLEYIERLRNVNRAAVSANLSTVCGHVRRRRLWRACSSN